MNPHAIGDRMTPQKTTALALLSLLLPGTALAASEARLTPPVVAPGRSATLQIITDTGAVPSGLGQLSGVTVQPGGRSSQISVINGVVSQQSIYTYTVTPQHSGTFTLGPFQVGPDTTAPVTLTAAAGSAPAPGGASPRASASPSAPSPRSTASARDTSERAFLRLWIPDDSLYVGQSVPLTVSAYLRDDVGGTLESFPQMVADDFILKGIDEDPTRSSVEVDGQTYTRFTWTASLTPARAGDHPLSVTIPATLQWVEHTARPQQRRSLIEELLANDPFFQGSGLGQIFGSTGLGAPLTEPEVRTAKVDLRADRGEITVLSPPVEGRPEDFRGAVGQLEMSVEALATTGKVGEPIELTWQVSGTGNLKNLRMDGIAEGEGYSVYPPESEFTPSVRSQTKGTVRFTQLIVPREPGALQLPDLQLSYLDPDDGTYHTLAETLQPISVSPAADAVSAVVPPAADARDEETAVLARDVHQDSLLPWTARNGVAWLGALGWLLVLVSGLLGAQLSRAAGTVWSVPATWVRRKLLHRKLRRGIASTDADAFFRAGLQLVEEQLGSDAVADPVQLPEGVRSFLSGADRAIYAHQLPDQETMRALHEQLVRDLSQEEAA